MIPQLSIIIPSYNSEELLPGCLDSIISQTFQQFEVIIQDGNSTDNTSAIVKSYVSRYPSVSIKWNSEKDGGIYDAMNRALMIASGEYVYFTGSDDRLYDKNVLQEVFNNPSNLQYDVLYGNVFSTRFNGVYGGIFTEDRILHDNICHQSIFFKRSVFDITGPYDIKFKGLSDWDHNFKWFFSAAIKKHFINITIAAYADGGYSSVKFDWEFEKVRIIKYLSLRKTGLPFETKVKYYISCIKTALKTKDYVHLQKVLLKTPSILFHS